MLKTLATLHSVWSWIKLNATVLVVASAVCAGATTFAYFKGRDHGGDACVARYEKRDAAQHREVINQLNAINAQNIELGKLWAKQNRERDAEIKTEIRTIYREVEKLVEVPVQVEGPCRIDYTGTARLLDGAVGAAYSP